MTLNEIQAWLGADQYEHGEWGRSEAVNPTDDPRNLELSRLKPNLFTSTQAILALLATGFEEEEVFSKFFTWLTQIRGDDGYWTNASGSLLPMGSGPARGWSEVRNVRHTAKALDILMLWEDFVPEDAIVFNGLLESQLSTGAFPQYPEAGADLWTTAYLMNLLIRAQDPQNLLKTRQRGTSPERWESRLRTALGQAREWMCGQLKDHGLWELGGSDPYNITAAVIAEIGGDLRFHRPDICKLVADTLLSRSEAMSHMTLWGLMLLLPSLRSEQQRRVQDFLHNIDQMPIPRDTFQASCYCRLAWLKDKPDTLAYYVQKALGHESAISNNGPWASSEYELWCVRNVLERVQEQDIRYFDSPTTKADAWISAQQLLESFKRNVEQERGWQLLWADKSTPRDEGAAQVLFWGIASTLTNERGTIIREPDTGRGPVDFEFLNGHHCRIYIEFKLASNPRYIHGLEHQLIAYMDAQDIDSSYYVLVGYKESDRSAFERIKDRLLRLQEEYPHKFVQAIYIDASPRLSASRSV